MKQNAGGVAAQAPLRCARRNRRALGLRIVEAAMWVVAVTGLGLAGWIVADMHLYRARAEASLARAVTPASPSLAKAIDPGTPIARLRIPRLGLSAIVAEGVDAATLRHAVGRVPTSARPGEAGNVALAGHRDTLLRPLSGIREGDLIQLDSPAAHDRYRVEWTAVVPPRDVEAVGDTPYPALTLVTCYPFGYIGPAPQRFIVRARRIAPPGGPRS